MELIAFGGKEHKSIERPLKLLVPIDYFSFLSKTNGGIVLASSGTIQIPGTTAKVAPHIFLGVDIARKNYDMEHVTGLYKAQLQWDSTIFAIDFDENYFFFGRTGVYYWDITNKYSGDGEKIYFVSSSFADFIKAFGGIDVLDTPERRSLLDQALKVIQQKPTKHNKHGGK